MKITHSAIHFFSRKATLLAIFFIPFLSFSQTPFFEDVPFTYQNSQVKTQKILKEKTGKLFFGTNVGLFTYDGIAFKKIPCIDSLKDETVTALYQSAKGLIWAGFRDGSIAYCNENKLYLVNPEEGLPKVSITGFAESNDGTLWIATNGEGLYAMSGKHLKNINTDDGLNDNYVHAILGSTNTEAIIAASDQGLNACTISEGKKSVKNIFPGNSLPDNIITSLTVNGNSILVGTQDKGICTISLSGGKETIEIPGISKTWQSGMVNKVVTISDEVWIATDDYGLVIADAATGKFKFNIRNTAYFPHSKINDLVADNEGNVWISCSDGLVKSSGKKIRFWESLPDEKISFVHTIIFDSSGNCWFSPDQGLVKMWQDEQGNLHSQKFTITPPEKLVDIVTLYADPYGFLWIGTMGSGIYQLHIESSKIRKVTENPALVNGSILNISGKGDDVWIGGFDGTSHCRILNHNAGKEQLGFINNNATEMLGNYYIYSIFTDREDRSWFGTDGDGAYLFDGKVLTKISSSHGLDASTIYSILEDDSGNTWFNTQDHGIYKYDGKAFYNYSLSSGLSDASVSSMIFDKSGNLLLIHKNGIDILNRKENRFTYLKNNALLTNVNPDLNSVAMNAAGDVFIGTEKFILQLSSSAINSQPFPVTFLENISIFQNNISDSLHSFPSEQNNFSFAFNGLWYSNPSLVQYQYKLEGFNDQWINTTDREINFPKLSPGSYIFRVRSSLNNDFAHASEAYFNFIITPPFWKTNWFQFLFALVIALLLYAFIRWRDRRIRKMDLLRKESVEFQFEMLKSQVNPHFLFNSFNTLISVIEEDQKTAVSYVEKLSEFFRSIVAYRDKNLIPLREEIHLLNNYFFLQQKRYGNHLKLNINISENIQDAYEIPPLTLQLLMENALKHNAVSKESPLWIELEADNSGMLTIKNNINPKITGEKSSGLGLQNITNRFKLLTVATVEVLNDGNKFIVRIPLIRK